MSKLNIAIDGPAGAGKSTIAKIISKKLGIIYLDTGAMYRAVALKAINEGINTRDAAALEKLAQNIDISIIYQDSVQLVLLDGNDVSGQIRTPEVSKGASDVSAVPAVRLKMVELQRNIAKNADVVMDGRDIGTFVLPHASLKILLTASIDERAKRRYEEQLSKGMTGITLDEVKKDIEYRDKNDSERAFAPLSKAQDAIEVDTTNSSIDEVVSKIIFYVESKSL